MTQNRNYCTEELTPMWKTSICQNERTNLLACRKVMHLFTDVTQPLQCNFIYALKVEKNLMKRDLSVYAYVYVCVCVFSINWTNVIILPRLIVTWTKGRQLMWVCGSSSWVTEDLVNVLIGGEKKCRQTDCEIISKKGKIKIHVAPWMCAKFIYM